MKIYQKIARLLEGIQFGKDKGLPDIESWNRDKLKELVTPKNAKIFVPHHYTGIIVFVIQTPSEKSAIFVHPNLSDNFMISRATKENEDMFTEFLNQAV